MICITSSNEKTQDVCLRKNDSSSHSKNDFILIGSVSDKKWNRSGGRRKQKVFNFRYLQLWTSNKHICFHKSATYHVLIAKDCVYIALCVISSSNACNINEGEKLTTLTYQPIFPPWGTGLGGGLGGAAVFSGCSPALDRSFAAVSHAGGHLALNLSGSPLKQLCKTGCRITEQ